MLIYYLVANIAAFTQPATDRRYPKALQVVGAVACVALVATLPPLSVVLGILMFAAGIILRLARLSSVGFRPCSRRSALSRRGPRGVL